MPFSTPTDIELIVSHTKFLTKALFIRRRVVPGRRVTLQTEPSFTERSDMKRVFPADRVKDDFAQLLITRFEYSNPHFYFSLSVPFIYSVTFTFVEINFM